MKKISMVISMALGLAAGAQVPLLTKSKNLEVANQLSLGGKLVKKVSTDSSLSENAETSLVSERAVKGYVDQSVPYLNVKKFGAKGDGSTNDAPAIQAAINALRNTGGTLFFPKGNYRLLTGLLMVKNNATDYDNIVLLGEGYRTQVSCAPNMADASLRHMLRGYSTTAAPLRNVEVRNIFFNGNATGQMGKGGGGEFHGGVYFENVLNCKVEGNYFERCGTMAVYLGRYMTDNSKGAVNCIVANNTIKKCFADGIYNQINRNCQIINNRVDSSGSTVEHYAVFCEGAYDCVISGNSVSACQEGVMVNNSGTNRRSNTVVSSNTVKGVEAYGIYIAGSYGVTVSSNAVSFTKECGILVFRANGALPVQNAGNVVTGNIVYASYKSGIAILDNFNVVTNNSITNCAYNNITTKDTDRVGIALAAGASFNLVQGNKVYNVVNNEDGELNGYTKYGVYLAAGCVQNTCSNNFINDGMFGNATLLYKEMDSNRNLMTGTVQRGYFDKPMAATSTVYQDVILPTAFRSRITDKKVWVGGWSAPSYAGSSTTADDLATLRFIVTNAATHAQTIRVYWEVEGY